MRIAFFTTLSPVQSALSDFSEGLALALSNIPGVTVDLFISGLYKPINLVITSRFKIYSHHDFERRAREYDVCLYSMGDHSSYHGFMLEYLYRYPGIVILNDLTLHRCILQTALAHNNVQAYLDELENAYGLRNLRFAEQIQAGLGNHLILDYPLFERTVDSSRGTIVQNHYARNAILAKRPQAQVACIPYPFFMPPGFPAFQLDEQRTQQRARLGLEDHFTVGSFGLFVADKHLEDCLSAFAHVAQKYPKSKYILGGQVLEGYDLAGRIKKMGLEGQVIITGWLAPPQFAQHMFALDAGIHLRYPHIGGTPYTPIRLMGLEVCTIVSDIEPLAELPQGSCIKIAPDDYQRDTLTALLEYLADHSEFRRQIGENGRQFIARHHDIGEIAQRYVDFIQSVST